MQPKDNASSGLAVAGVSWVAANLPQINLWLQLVLTVIGIIGGIYAIILYRKRNKILDSRFTDTGSFQAYKPGDK